MKRYSGFELDLPYSWHSSLVVLGDPMAEKPFVCVPKPIACLFRIWLTLRIWYYVTVLHGRGKTAHFAIWKEDESHRAAELVSEPRK